MFRLLFSAVVLFGLVGCSKSNDPVSIGNDQSNVEQNANNVTIDGSDERDITTVSVDGVYRATVFGRGSIVISVTSGQKVEKGKQRMSLDGKDYIFDKSY